MTLDIMMPFYGRFDHFRVAVESVLAQSDPDWRLVIVDDVYPDLAPGQWADAIDDPRVTYLRNESNLGTSRNYLKCVDLMSAEFAVIMGCDDVMLPGYVARVRELLAGHPDVSVVQPGVATIDADGQRNHPLADRVKALYRPRGRGPRVYAGERLATSLLRGNWTYFPSLVWRVSELHTHGFRTDLTVVQDLAMLLDIARSGGSLLLDDETRFEYRRHASSVSARTGVDGSKFGQEATLFRESDAAFRELGWRRAARAARRHFTSRMNALSELPRAMGRDNASSRRLLLSHVFGSTAGQ
ncbi:MAG: glycosyltransferase family 2 protein [Rhodoglobus sp.]|nr:glycosyltransferase family 2 protein [Rhodoglobus sp.]